MTQLIQHRLQGFLSPTDGTPASRALRVTPKRWTRTAWNQSEHSRGCYSYVPAGVTDLGIFSELGRRESEGLYFAGEHTHTTSCYRSSVRGAYMSGVAAAVQMLGDHNSQALAQGARPIPVVIPGIESYTCKW